MTAGIEQTRQTGAERLNGMRGRIIVSVAFALLVLIGLSLFADVRKLGTTLRDFNWLLAVPILLCSCANYAIRFGKWQYYLHLAGVRDLPPSLSARIFISGFAMSVTPGKIGEVLKALLVRGATGAPIVTTAPIIVAERLTDGVAMLALAAAGLAVFQYGVPLIATIAVAATLLYILLLQPRLMRRVIAAGEHVPILRRIVTHLHAFYETTYRLMAPRQFVIAALIGVVSWAFECVAFYLVLVGLGFVGTWHLLLLATFVLAAATLIGSVSLLPGGLGTAEISITAMLLALGPKPPMTQDIAVAATLLIRFSTLWFAVLLGVVALASVRYLLRARDATPALTPAPAPAPLAGTTGRRG